MMSSEVEDNRLKGTSPFPFFSTTPPSLLLCEEELDPCLEYTTGGMLPSAGEPGARGLGSGCGSKGGRGGFGRDAAYG